jgi:hypothetical protein
VHVRSQSGRSLGNGNDREFFLGKFKDTRLIVFVQGKLVACNEPLWLSDFGSGFGNETNWSCLKIGNLESLFDMKLSRLAVFVDAIPIVKPKGAVTGLLNLSYEQAFSQGMERSRRNEDTITRLWAQDVQAFFGSFVFDRFLESFSVDTFFEASIEFGVGCCFNHIPGFRLSPIWLRHFGTVFVVWMHLDAEYSLTIQILQKERKAFRRGVASDDFDGKRFD